VISLGEVLTYYDDDEMEKLIVELRMAGESHPQFGWIDYIVEYLETDETEVPKSIKKMGCYKINNASTEALNALVNEHELSRRRSTLDPNYFWPRTQQEWRIRTMAVELFGPKIVEFFELRGVLSIGVQQ